MHLTGLLLRATTTEYQSRHIIKSGVLRLLSGSAVRGSMVWQISESARANRGVRTAVLPRQLLPRLRDGF